MARRPPTLPEFAVSRDPLNDAVLEDRENVADRLSEVLAELGNLDQGSIKGILYRIPVPNGKFEWIRDCFPPFDISEIMRGLKEEIGGGDYALRIMAENRVRKTIHFSIMKDKGALTVDSRRPENSDLTAMMFQMMMRQSEEASRQRADDARERAAAAERQTTMLVGLAGVLAPLIMGGKDKTSEVMAAIAPLLNRGEGMKEALETLTLAKGLFKEEPSNQFDADDLVGSGIRMAGPIVGAIGKAFQDRRQNLQELPAPPDRPPLQFSPPNPRLAHSLPPPANGGKYPVLDLIREDVLYCFARNHDPEKAADLVFDTLESAGVTEAQINELVAAFTISPDWLAELANEGLELRSNPEWANEFLGALVAIYREGDENGPLGGDANNRQRRNGSPANSGDNGEPRAEGLAENADTEPSG